MRRRCWTAGIAGLIVGLGVGWFLADYISRETELSPTRMLRWERMVKNCGGIYYALVNTGLEDMVSDMKEKTLNHAKTAGASSVQLLLLFEIFDEQESRVESEGIGSDYVVSEVEKKELIRLAPILRGNCAGDSLIFPVSKLVNQK